MSAFTTMTEIGKLFGESSHTIGNWLVDVGLRTAEKKPSRKAFAGGYVKQLPTPGNPEGYFWGWHRLKTVFALEMAGHVQLAHHPTGRLVGPFELLRSGSDGFEVTSSDGGTAVFVLGEANAKAILKLMNAAHNAGGFGGRKENARPGE